MDRLVITVIDDNSEDQERITEHCNAVGEQLASEIQVCACTSLEDFASQAIEPDVLIVDLRLGDAVEDRSGWEPIRKSLGRRVVPVIVYSAYADEEPPQELRSLLIIPVRKGAGEFQNILERSCRMKLRLNQEWQRVRTQFEGLTLETAGLILGEQTGTGIEALDENTLASMAIARLTSYLINVPYGSPGKFPPESIFIIPPLEIEGRPKECLCLGDFLEEKANTADSRLWFVAAPSCDLFFDTARKEKVEGVLLLRCYSKTSEVPFLRGRNSSSRKDAIASRIKDRTASVLKCPLAVFGTKIIFMCFKDYRTTSYKNIREGIRSGKWKRIATLATPYAESLQNLFIRDLSRIGTPVTATRDEELGWADAFCSECTLKREQSKGGKKS